MSSADFHSHADLTEVVEALARTVAHLAVQLTITQIQLRGLGQVLQETGSASGEAVLKATSDLSRRHAGAFIRENLGSALEGLVDVSELEREIIDFLDFRP